MKVSYFPGCTLRTKAKKLDFYARKCAEILGVEMCEIKDWQCCGGVFVSAKDEIASKLSSVRALKAAKKDGQPLVTVCSACHNVIKQTNHEMQTDKDFAAKANLYMSQDKDFDGEDYNGETEVVHYLELLKNTVGFDKIKAAVKNPLTAERLRHTTAVCSFVPARLWLLTTLKIPRLLRISFALSVQNPLFIL